MSIQAFSEPFSIFLRTYYLTLPLALVSLFVEPLQYLYAAIFFGLGVYLLFIQETPDLETASSSERHLEVKGRGNWLNYIIAAALCISSLTFVFLPWNKGLLVILLWSAFAHLVLFYLPELDRRLELQLIVDYIHSQLPDLSSVEIKDVVNQLFAGNREVETKLEKAELAKIQHYFDIYTNRIYQEKE